MVVVRAASQVANTVHRLNVDLNSASDHSIGVECSVTGVRQHRSHSFCSVVYCQMLPD